MAHLIESMFYVGEVPWHGLGVDATNTKIQTSKQALELAGLDWKVSKDPLFHKVNDQILEIKNQYVNVRSSDGSALGIVGENYTILQNESAFQVLDSLLAEGLTFETGGSIKSGKEVFALMKLPQIVIGQDDVTNNYILLSNSHDGSKAISFGLTQVRVVCNNTLTMALNSGASKLLKIRHTKNAQSALIEAKEAINLVTAQIEGTRAIYEKMIKLDVTKESLENYFRIVTDIQEREVKDSKTLVKLFELYEGGIGQDKLGNNLYRAYQAVTEYDTHHRTLRGDGKLENRLINVFDIKSLANKGYEVASSMVA